MKPFLPWLLVALTTLSAAENRAPRITSEEIPLSAAAGTAGVSLTKAPDDSVWLSWVEPAKDGANALRFSVFDRVSLKWTSPATILRDKSVAANSADAPQ